MEVGRTGWAAPETAREDDEGRASWVPPERALPEKAGHFSPFKVSGCLQTSEGEMLWLPEKPPFLLGCRISPGWRVSGEGQGCSTPAGRSVQMLRRVPGPGAAPRPRLEKVRKGASRNPSSAHLETPTRVSVRLLAGN